jgi:hypothetical protein
MSGQNFQQMPHWMQSSSRISGRMFRQDPVLFQSMEPTDMGMVGISASFWKTTFWESRFLGMAFLAQA